MTLPLAVPFAVLFPPAGVGVAAVAFCFFAGIVTCCPFVKVMMVVFSLTLMFLMLTPCGIITVAAAVELIPIKLPPPLLLPPLLLPPPLPPALITLLPGFMMLPPFPPEIPGAGMMTGTGVGVMVVIGLGSMMVVVVVGAGRVEISVVVVGVGCTTLLGMYVTVLLDPLLIRPVVLGVC